MTFSQRWPQYGGATVKLQPPTTAHHLSSNGREIHSGSGGSRGGEETENAVVDDNGSKKSD